MSMYVNPERILVKEAAYIPLYYPYAVNVIKPFVQGILFNSDDQPVTDNNIYRSLKTELFITDAV